MARDFEDLVGLVNTADGWQAAAAADLAEAERLAGELGGLTGRAADRSGAVKITVDASGALVDVRVDARAMSWPPQRLSRTILETSHAARRAYSEAAAARARSVLREGDEFLAAVEAGLRDRTPAEQPARGKSTW